MLAPMPLYYFDIYNDIETTDEEGAELADDGAARAYAVTSARSLAADCVKKGHLARSHLIRIFDADRNPVGDVRFDEAVEIRP